MLLAAAAIGAALAAQTTPDVVVTGKSPRMMAGLWRFRSGTVSIDPMPGGRLQPGAAGTQWDRCIADGDTQGILEQLVGQRAMSDAGSTCSRLTLTVERDRVFGSRRCMQALSTGAVAVQATRFRARIAERSLTADYVLQGSVAEASGPKRRWQVTAERVGDCPSAPDRKPAPLVAAEPLIRADPGGAEETPAVGPSPGAADHPPASVGTPRTLSPPVAGEADDVVVVARKLRVMRLHYASDGAIFRWCHADSSSGDPRIDRIGCALVRACVREGSDTVPDTLACYHRKVDTLDPVTGPLPRPVAARGK